MNERRRDRRFPVEASAVLKIGKKPQVASVVNVSFHGLSLSVEEPPPLRQLVQVELDLPTGKMFSVHAMVVHVAANRIGLEFFGRNSNPDWDDFMQSMVRSSLLPPEPQQPAQARPPPRPPPPPPPPSRRSAGAPPNLPATAPSYLPATAPPNLPGLPSRPPSNLPGHGPPNLPGHGPPNFPSQSAPNFPSQSAPNFPSQSAPNFPSQSAPNFPSQSAPNFPSQSAPNFPSQGPLNPSNLPLPASNPANAPPFPPQGAQPVAKGALLRPDDPPYQGQERRRVPRINLQLELRLRTPRSIHTAFTRSVSMIGATLVLHDGQLGIGEQVIVNLIQPGTNFSFKREGVVRRVQPAADGLHVGVEFSGLDTMREVLFADFMNTAYATLSTS